MRKIFFTLIGISCIVGLAYSTSVNRAEPLGSTTLSPTSLYVCDNTTTNHWVPAKVDNVTGALITNASSLYESKITSGANDTYWAGNKTWQTLPQTSPGGNTTQFQYNNNGTFGGISSLVYNGTEVQSLNNFNFVSGKGFKINEAIAGRALSYDGIDGVTTLTYKSALNAGPYTFDTWFKFNGSVPSNDAILYSNGGSGMIFAFDNPSTQPVAIYIFWQGTQEYWITSSSSLVWEPDTWYHIRYTWDNTLGSNNIKVYVNGVLDGQQTDTNIYPTSSSNGEIGAYHGGAVEYGRVVLDEVRLSNIVRTDTPWDGNGLTSDANTVFLVHLDEGTGNPSDVSSNAFTCTNSGGVSWVDGVVNGEIVNKNILQRTSGSPSTTPGTVTVGYNEDIVKLGTMNGILKATNGVLSAATEVNLTGNVTAANFIGTSNTTKIIMQSIDNTTWSCSPDNSGNFTCS